MKITSLLQTAALALALPAAVAFAQDNAAAPTSPASNAAVAPVAAPDHVVYLAKLPLAADLMRGAAAQGTTITRIDQTSDSVSVTYQYTSGRVSTFSFRLLSSAANETSAPVTTLASGPAPAPASGSPTVVYAQPAPTVVYAERPVYYSDPAWDFWGPLAVGVGIGWISHGWGWHGGGWHGGGWHGGHGWHH